LVGRTVVHWADERAEQTAARWAVKTAVRTVVHWAALRVVY